MEAWAKQTRGFTIVELLIVIVVIAILAAITLVAYNGIANRANSNTVQADLSNFAKKIELYKVDNNQYPQATSAGLSTLGMKITTASYDVANYNFYYCTPTDRSEYAIAARSKAGETFYVSSSGRGSLGNVLPSWTVSCGTIGYSVLSDIAFCYIYNKGTGAWSSWAQ